MIKLAIIRLANLIGPRQQRIRSIGLPDTTMNDIIYARTFDEVILTPHRWQTKLAHWVLGDVRESRINWNNIPPYESRFDWTYGSALADEKLQFGYGRDYLKSDIERSLSDWGVQHNANWNFAPRRCYKVLRENGETIAGDSGPSYDAAYYDKLRTEIEKLLCVDDPRSLRQRIKFFKGGMPRQQGGVVY